MPTLRFILLLTLGLLHPAPPVMAGEAHVAVASNFADALKTLATRYQQAAGHRIILAAGSSGRHYAQIKNGAPFDAFFAADVERPQRLEAEAKALPGSRFTYAIGKLVLWSPVPGLVDPKGEVLRSDRFRHLALANPKLAPYGAAAEQVMRALGVWDRLQPRLVRGENIAQTLQFVSSGNAELGFVAYAQVARPNEVGKGSFWAVPSSLHAPIEQQAVLLRDNPVAHDFMTFVKGREARDIILRYGYDVP